MTLSTSEAADAKLKTGTASENDDSARDKPRRKPLRAVRRCQVVIRYSEASRPSAAEDGGLRRGRQPQKPDKPAMRRPGRLTGAGDRGGTVPRRGQDHPSQRECDENGEPVTEITVTADAP